MDDKTLIPELFGAALEKRRKEADMTRAELARRIGHQHVRVVKLEKGGSDLRLSSILKLTMALGITPGELLDEVQEAYRQALDIKSE